MIQTDTLNAKTYTQQRVNHDTPCTFCRKPITHAMISWRHEHNVLHNQCFRRLQREDGK